jgi:hypothetical protein
MIKENRHSLVELPNSVASKSRMAIHQSLRLDQERVTHSCRAKMNTFLFKVLEVYDEQEKTKLKIHKVLE